MTQRSIMFSLLVILSLAVVWLMPQSIRAAGQSSANYIISKDVISTGGGERSSASFILKDTIGQSSAIGKSESTNFTLYAGFWGPVAVTPTPTIAPTETPTATATLSIPPTVTLTPTNTVPPTPAPVPTTSSLGAFLIIILISISFIFTFSFSKQVTRR